MNEARDRSQINAQFYRARTGFAAFAGAFICGDKTASYEKKLSSQGLSSPHPARLTRTGGLIAQFYRAPLQVQKLRRFGLSFIQAVIGRKHMVRQALAFVRSDLLSCKCGISLVGLRYTLRYEAGR